MWVQRLKTRVRLPAFDLPSFEVDTTEDIERAAEACREHWGLGDAPLRSVSRILENAGVIVTRLAGETTKIDAFSRFGGSLNVIVLNTSKGSNSRAIFDSLHEIGHGVLHRDVPERPFKEKETEANYFAGALLLPRRTFPREFWAGGGFDLSHLVDLKQRWGTSIQAILYRAHQLGLLNSAEFRRWQRTIARKGWRRGVPEPAEPDEMVPELLDLGVCAAENRDRYLEGYRRRFERFAVHRGGSMGTTFRPYQPDQMLLLPQDLREWVPEGHLAHHVSDLVDALDLSPFYAPYEGDGRRNSPYDPQMIVKVLIYAYATGTFSSRKMARKLEEDIAFRMLAAGNFPQHRTLCEFRRRHLQDCQAVFAEVVRLARGVGLAGFGRVSVDGTKVRANASKRKAMSYGRMVKAERRLRAEIGALLKRAEAVDEAEDARYGEDARGDELPEELKRREDRLAAIEEAKARLEAEQRAMDDARGRKPGQARNPKGGKPYKREYGEPDEEGAEQLHGPREPDHEDELGRIPAVLQRTDGRGRGEPTGGGDDGDGPTRATRASWSRWSMRWRTPTARCPNRCWRTRTIATSGT